MCIVDDYDKHIILRIMDQNTSDNDEKTLVISVLQHNECEKLHELLAIIDCTDSLTRTDHTSRSMESLLENLEAARDSTR